MSTSHGSAISNKGEKKQSFTMFLKCETIEYAERESNQAAELGTSESGIKTKGQSKN